LADVTVQQNLYSSGVSTAKDNFSKTLLPGLDTAMVIDDYFEQKMAKKS